MDSGDRDGNYGHHRYVCYLILGTIGMQKNFAPVSVFILFAGLQGGVMNCADEETLAIEILSLASFPPRKMK